MEFLFVIGAILLFISLLNRFIRWVFCVDCFKEETTTQVEEEKVKESIPYVIVLRKEGNHFVATLPDMDHLKSFGDTVDDALDYLKKSVELYIVQNRTIPKNSTIAQLRARGEIKSDDSIHTLHVDIV